MSYRCWWVTGLKNGSLYFTCWSLFIVTAWGWRWSEAHPQYTKYMANVSIMTIIIGIYVVHLRHRRRCVVHSAYYIKECPQYNYLIVRTDFLKACLFTSPNKCHYHCAMSLPDHHSWDNGGVVVFAAADLGWLHLIKSSLDHSLVLCDLQCLSTRRHPSMDQNTNRNMRQSSKKKTNWPLQSNIIARQQEW